MGEFKAERNLMGGKSIGNSLQVFYYCTTLELAKLLGCKHISSLSI